MLFYDINLLIIKNKSENFGIVRLQTNNTSNIKTKIFINKEKVKIIEAKFKTKSQIILENIISRDFNSCYMIIKDKSIIVV